MRQEIKLNLGEKSHIGILTTNSIKIECIIKCAMLYTKPINFIFRFTPCVWQSRQQKA